jgi:hypothetical protein
MNVLVLTFNECSCLGLCVQIIEHYIVIPRSDRFCDISCELYWTVLHWTDTYCTVCSQGVCEKGVVSNYCIFSSVCRWTDSYACSVFDIPIVKSSVHMCPSWIHHYVTFIRVYDTQNLEKSPVASWWFTWPDNGIEHWPDMKFLKLIQTMLLSFTHNQSECFPLFNCIVASWRLNINLVISTRHRYCLLGAGEIFANQVLPFATVLYTPPPHRTYCVHVLFARKLGWFISCWVMYCLLCFSASNLCGGLQK